MREKGMPEDLRKQSLLWMAVTVLASAGLVGAQVPMVSEALDEAQRFERLGIVGVLGACLVVSVAANVWLLRVMGGRLFALMERAIVVGDHMVDASKELKQSADDLKETRTHCQHSIAALGAAAKG